MNDKELLNKLLDTQRLQVVKSDFIGEEKLHLEIVCTLPVVQMVDAPSRETPMK
ncbi:MAG: hypothetical protein HUU11_12795 [Anaerolineales bacterium]|nr:hypothetical protein [Anaerolineales bacterium]